MCVVSFGRLLGIVSLFVFFIQVSSANSMPLFAPSTEGTSDETNIVKINCYLTVFSKQLNGPISSQSINIFHSFAASEYSIYEAFNGSFQEGSFSYPLNLSLEYIPRFQNNSEEGRINVFLNNSPFGKIIIRNNQVSGSIGSFIGPTMNPNDSSGTYTEHGLVTHPIIVAQRSLSYTEEVPAHFLFIPYKTNTVQNFQLKFTCRK